MRKGRVTPLVVLYLICAAVWAACAVGQSESWAAVLYTLVAVAHVVNAGIYYRGGRW
jgi:hypothetical protein